MKSAFAAVLLSIFGGAVLAAPPGYTGGGVDVGKPAYSDDKCQTKHVKPDHDGGVIPGVDLEQILGKLLKRDDVRNHAGYAPETDKTKITASSPRPTDPTDCVETAKANKPAKTRVVRHAQDMHVQRRFDIHSPNTTTSEKNGTLADDAGSGSGLGFLDTFSKAIGAVGTTLTNALAGGGKKGEKAAHAGGVPAKGVPTKGDPTKGISKILGLL
ncbi:hypothetical protein E4U42_005987 [Claviceps africana]|uniref:Uncharacterized protein n=1 Tax=Claviceps africana TaxID=83212 RepID=A0A8K0JBD2_9HYPO|nr:hypothetical protein E4U42_005987 [Claviceps africana]